MMKFTLTIFLFVVSQFQAHSQIYEPVKWNFSAVKQNDLTYNIYLKADIQPTWHVYSHIQPKDAIAQPLRIVFNRNPQVSLYGKAIEVGKLEKSFDKETRIRANQYSNTVAIRQTVKLKSPQDTEFSGTLTYQTCNDERCLPPEDVEFVVKLD